MPFYPWSCLLLYGFCLSLLAYAPLPLPVKFWILAFGFFLPGLWTLSSKPRSGPKENAFWNAEVFPPALAPAVPLLALGLAGFRAWEWSQGRAWPTADESITGTQALLLMEKGGWEHLHRLGQTPPLWPTAVSLLLRWTHSPFFSLWFPSGLCFLATLGMGYLACRQFGGRSFSLLFTFLLASSYWLLSLQRLSFQETTLPLWVLASLWAWGRYVRFPKASRRKRDALFLGILLGLGPFTFFSWVPIALGLFCLLAAGTLGRPPRQTLHFFIFLTGLCLGLGLFLACAGKDFTQRMWAIAGWRNEWKAQSLVVLNYFSALLGGTFGGLNAYMLWGGGLLNPLLGGFFLAGALERLRAFTLKKAGGIVAAFLLLMAPGLLSNTVALFRIVQILPLAVFLAAMGIQWALGRLEDPRLRRWLLSAILLSSLAFDLARLERPGWDIRGHEEELPRMGATCEQFQAFSLLEKLEEQEGPGLVFSGFTPQSRDQSLAYATFPWNAAWNPALRGMEVRWAAVVCPIHYAPFLTKTFPEGHWFYLDSQIPGRPGPNLLGIIPLDGRTAPLLRSWAEIYPNYQGINMEELDLANGISRRIVLQQLRDLYPRIPHDPFLQSCFFEKLLYDDSWERTFHPQEARTLPGDLPALFGVSFQGGCQDAVLCEKYGKWLALEGDDAGAKRMFKKALVLDPGNGSLKDEIRQLQSQGGK